MKTFLKIFKHYKKIEFLNLILYRVKYEQNYHIFKILSVIPNKGRI